MMGARREARDTLAAAGLRPHKRWGQHFLCDPAVARRIVDTAALRPGAAVLEIGPGLGALTDLLAVRAAALYLVEIDRGMAARLAERYASQPHVHVVVGDVLALPLEQLVPADDVTVVANLPYNVSTPVLFRLLALRGRVRRAILMLQREVARRLAAPAGAAERGMLSVMVQTWATVRLAFGVSRRSFLPRPRVDSAVVVLDLDAAPRVPLADVAVYEAVVRAAFGQRRKMLRNALGSFGAARAIGPAELDARVADAGIDPRARAETLTLHDFARLAAVFAA
jgi:16S rRNA (adenine1518-N6/adenine1519-N6)-dimethyltransferase